MTAGRGGTRDRATIVDVAIAAGAIVCACDLLALGAVRAVRRRGLEPGDDVGVVGFDDSDIAESVELTSLRQPLREAAAAAWRIVQDGGTDPALSALLAPSVVVRRSTTRATR